MQHVEKSVNMLASNEFAGRDLAEKTSIDRAFDILDLLDDQHPSVSPEEIGDALGLTRSTTYRYLKVLCNAGLLMQLSRGAYSLGPRVVELERKIQISDPLLAAGKKVMPRHADAVPDSVLLLCGLWGERVLCLHQENARTSTARPLPILRARGLPFSLFKGAASLAILANLPPARIKSLYLKHSQDIAAAELGSDWLEFRKRLQAIRKAGYAITTGTFDSGLTAISAPVLNGENTVIGSVTRILSRVHSQSDVELSAGIQRAAADFAGALTAAQSDTETTDHAAKAEAGLLHSITDHALG